MEKKELYNPLCSMGAFLAAWKLIHKIFEKFSRLANFHENSVHLSYNLSFDEMYQLKFKLFSDRSVKALILLVLEGSKLS